MIEWKFLYLLLVSKIWNWFLCILVWIRILLLLLVYGLLFLLIDIWNVYLIFGILNYMVLIIEGNWYNFFFLGYFFVFCVFCVFVVFNCVEVDFMWVIFLFFDLVLEIVIFLSNLVILFLFSWLDIMIVIIVRYNCF